MEMPSSLLVNQEKANRGIVFTPELAAVLPDLQAQFAAVNALQRGDGDFKPYIERYTSSVFEIEHGLGKVSCLALYDENVGNRANVFWMPFTDCAPTSTPSEAKAYMEIDKPNTSDKAMGAPNSHGAALKVATTHDLEAQIDGTESGSKLTLAFFAPRPLTIYSLRERSQVWRGDFTPDTELVTKALEHVEEKLGAGSDLQFAEKFTDIDFAGASKGAHQAVATAHQFLRRGLRDVRSVTTQEMILGTETVADLGKRYLIAQHVGEVSGIRNRTATIKDLDLRRKFDENGNELAMVFRMLQGMSKFSDVVGMSKRLAALRQISGLRQGGVPVTSFYGVNSSVSYRTPEIFGQHFGDSVAVVPVVAVKHQMGDHLINENHNLFSTTFALGSRR